LPEVDFVSKMPRGTRHDYVQRIIEFDMPSSAKVSKKFSAEYWDGDRQFGFGGYHYDSRWQPVARRIAAHYDLKPGDRILDIGCGKAHLLYDLITLVPGLRGVGLDISEYGVNHAPASVRSFLSVGTCTDLPFPDGSFDLVFSITTFHNLLNYQLDAALREMQRVGRRNRFICEEAYRTEQEKTKLLYWGLVCECFHTPDEWQWYYDRAGYEGDVDFIIYE
jgi:ubiquinone/menaquinone biosynthesis C-methylase UbiE